MYMCFWSFSENSNVRCVHYSMFILLYRLLFLANGPAIYVWFRTLLTKTNVCAVKPPDPVLLLRRGMVLDKRLSFCIEDYDFD